MGYRPPRSYYYHLSGAQLREIDAIAKARGSLVVAGLRYGLTGKQVSTALVRYRAQERLRYYLLRAFSPSVPDRSGQVTT